MEILIGREAHKALKKHAHMHNQIKQLKKAIDNFQSNIRHPALNFEKLGSGERQNHYSIRASRELRIILAIDQKDCLIEQPERALVVNLGQHDPMYEWADRQEYFTDISEEKSLDGHGVENLEDWLKHEEWQLFLHPAQKKYVSHSYSREARIFGGAGTGKTVIGLHRIARLAREQPHEKFLVTAFHKTLIGQLESMFTGMPQAPKNVIFRNIHKIAFDICRTTDCQKKINMNHVDEAFESAYQRVIVGSVLKSCTRQYIREEVERVIKGRAASREDYLATDKFERIGRIRGFKRKEREACYDLLEQWNREMDLRGTLSFEDMMLHAMQVTEAMDAPMYKSIFVDEGQDMSATGMRLIRALVAGKPENSVPEDGLLFVDDKTQQLYAGGFMPKWSGLKFHSRKLEDGLRTTRQVADAATAVRGRDLVDKSDQTDVDVVVHQRDGPKPFLVQTNEKEISKMIEIIKKIRDESPDHDDIGVIMHKRQDVTDCVEAFNGRGIPAVALGSKNLASVKGDASVKVVTFDSSKGLEFKVVMIPRIDRSMFPLTHEDQDALNELRGEAGPARKNRDDEARERRQLNLDRLYVGMTRARDMVFLVSSGDPCNEIQNARDFFDWYPVSRPIEIRTRISGFP